MSRIITYVRRLNWIDRLPRPERNGAKGAILMVHLFLSVLYAPLMGVDWPNWFDWFCDHNPIPQAYEAPHRYRRMMIVYGHRPGHGCACQTEYQVKNLPVQSIGPQYTCGSDDGDDNVWHPTVDDLRSWERTLRDYGGNNNTNTHFALVQICDPNFKCVTYGEGEVRWRWRCE